MTKVACLLTLLVGVLAVFLPTAPAQAQRDRVFVASYGSDSNPCTFGSPCKTFQNAANVVAAGGEVTAIDSAGFGPVTITQAVTITSPAGVEAGVQAASGGDAIDINAPGATVKLRGLTLEGAGVAQRGVYLEAGSRLEVVDCTVSDFLYDGIFVVPYAVASVLISNTIITDISGSGADGIAVTAAEGNITAVLDQVTLSGNFLGIKDFADDGSIEMLITNSHVDNSSNSGIYLEGENSSSANNVVLNNVTLNDDPVGIYLTGYSTVYLSQVTQSSVTGFTSTAINFFDGTNNTAYSDGTNHLMGTVTGGSTTSWAPN
jgi:hypothetical protein